MAKKKIWVCKIGEADDGEVPADADFPMRQAVRAMYKRVTGKEPDFIISGWAGKLTDTERAAVDERKKVSDG